ncbi:MAG: hypothetical protein M0R77_00870 [Gammaproteobacteria bacterium]|nr:hypothetical protein [Acholeplasmataceae bacterium]MCK9529107.1 hypothetical protein [Gammaproteobacteria bacterium]
MILEPVKIKTWFTVFIKTSGLPITDVDLRYPHLAPVILPILNGDEAIKFIDGVTRYTFDEDSFFAQPQELDLIIDRNVTRFLKQSLKLYIVSNQQFQWEVISYTKEIKEPEENFPYNSSIILE